MNVPPQSLAVNARAINRQSSFTTGKLNSFAFSANPLCLIVVRINFFYLPPPRTPYAATFANNKSKDPRRERCSTGPLCSLEKINFYLCFGVSVLRRLFGRTKIELHLFYSVPFRLAPFTGLGYFICAGRADFYELLLGTGHGMISLAQRKVGVRLSHRYECPGMQRTAVDAAGSTKSAFLFENSLLSQRFDPKRLPIGQ